MIDQQRMARQMQHARAELDAAIAALQQAREVLGRATWMRSTSPDGCHPWQHACETVYREADRTMQTVLKAAQTGTP